MGRRRSSPGGRGASSRRPWLVGAGLVLLILVLDFLGWLTGTTSFLFNPLLGDRTSAGERESVVLLVEGEMAGLKIKSSALRRFQDDQGRLHLKISLTADELRRLTPALKKKLADEGFVLAGEQQESDRRATHHLWEVRSRSGSPINILFSCPKTVPGPDKKSFRPESSRKTGEPAQAAIIMDDLGYNLEAARDACRLGLPLTLSILPFSPHAVSSAQVAHENGLEVMLHLPMESREHHDTEKYTLGLIEARLSDKDVREKVREEIFQVPYIRGVNNHMGSLLTEDESKMEIVLSVLREAGLYFIDSRTSAASRGVNVARRLGVPAAGCDLFLDSPDDAAALEKNLRALLRIAGKRGWALGIVHPYPATLETLKDCGPLFEEQGVELVPASRIVSRAAAR